MRARLAEGAAGGNRAAALSHQTAAPEARLPPGADDDMVMDADPQRTGRRDQFLGQGDVLAAGLGIARRMVVDDDQRCRAKLQRAAYYLAHMHGGLIDRPLGDKLVADEDVLGVQIKKCWRDELKLWNHWICVDCAEASISPILRTTAHQR